MKFSSRIPRGRSQAHALAQQKSRPAEDHQGKDASVRKGQADGSPGAVAGSAGLPGYLLKRLEASLGQDFSTVRIEKGSAIAAASGAQALTRGDSVHFAPGLFNPDSSAGRDLIGHEFVHVAQQRAGAVRPTHAMGRGLLLNQDRHLEQEAESLGRQVARGEPVARYRSPALGMRNAGPSHSPGKAVAQMSKQTSYYGDWFDDTYSLRASGQRRGVDMVLRFKPNAFVDAEKIGLTQAVQSIHNSRPFFPNSDPWYGRRAIKSGDAITNPITGMTDEGTRIDRLKSRNNPIFGSPAAAAGKGLADTPMDNNASAAATKVGITRLDPTANASYRLGFRFTDSGGTLKKQDAMLADPPSIGSVDVRRNSGQVFETTALALKGNQAGTYYGSVQWGWRTDSAGNHTTIPFKVVSEGVPSSTFLKSAERWNPSKSTTGAENIDLPLVDVHIVAGSAITLIQPAPFAGNLSLPVGTRLEVLRTASVMLNGEVRVVDGPHMGARGEVSSADWTNIADERS